MNDYVIKGGWPLGGGGQVINITTLTGLDQTQNDPSAIDPYMLVVTMKLLDFSENINILLMKTVLSLVYDIKCVSKQNQHLSFKCFMYFNFINKVFLKIQML